ncbi:MAG TPA: beta-N-acetylhexosaminidase [Terracidiphilus sp.]|jgi:beta-N-acetylhexosaminidase|nr:beta-N-acetylhexosaminidase [Terracidiphilus sp.]
MAMGLRQAAGSLLVVGLGGTELTGLERAWLRLIQPGGIILFKRNVAHATQTRALLQEAIGFCVPHAMRSVDVEGGTVNRLRDALAPLPSTQAVGAVMRSTGKPAFAFEHGVLIARAVKAFGFDTALAPVIDLGLPESAKVMGSRCAGPTWQDVVDYARPFLAGIKREGIVSCGKHFPGLGGGVVDSHFETPEIRRPWQSIWSDDLAPYRELRDELPTVMVNHAAYPETQSKNAPASASTFWITNILRKRIGYRGLIVSDDLEMGGILKFLPVDEAAVASLRAGTDQMLICHSAELILRSYESLVREAERSSAFRTLLLARAREVKTKQARLFATKTSRALTPQQLDALRAKILAFGETIAAQAQGDIIDPRAASPAEAS